MSAIFNHDDSSQKFKYNSTFMEIDDDDSLDDMDLSFSARLNKFLALRLVSPDEILSCLGSMNIHNIEEEQVLGSLNQLDYGIVTSFEVL
jgi:hypothetical protein